MWNDIVYRKGGLALHAGLKVIPTGDGEKVIMIIGLSGTGKTTTTFTTQNGSRAGAGRLRRADARRHAPTAPRTGASRRRSRSIPTFEPSIYGAVVKPTTYLENVYQDDAGTVNFFEESYTQNGRAVFEMSDLLHYRDARDVGTVDYLLILNRNENIIPAVAKLSQEQAAAYFMLGETTGTSAGGAAEAGHLPPRARHEPVLPPAARPAGQPDPGAPRVAPDRDVPAEHRPGRRQGRRRSLEEGEDPAHVGLREGDRRRHDLASPRTRTSATRSRSPCRTSTTSSSCSRAVSTSAKVGATSTRRSSIG